MPYVNESCSSSRVQVDVSRRGTKGISSAKIGKQQSQYGYRSVNVSSAEQSIIEGDLSLGKTLSIIQYLDEVGFGYNLRPNRPFLVHDRVSTKQTYGGPGKHQWVATLSSGSTRYVCDVVSHFSIEYATGTILPTMPGSSALASEAGAMMRHTMPNPESFNLYRSLAEQKDAKLILRGLSLQGTSPSALRKILGDSGAILGSLKAGRTLSKKAAELYLTWVFGVKPTLSDLQTAADIILRNDHGVRRVIMDDKARVRTGATKTIWSGSGYAENNGRFPNGNLPDAAITVGNGHCKHSYLTVGPVSSSNTNVLAPKLQVAWNGSQTLRQFATWEFFVPKPDEIENRLDGYRESAEALLGEGASAGTVYDLTPFTWLADWFVDVGGILHYQEALNNNQVAALSSGWSSYEQYTMRATFAGHRYLPDGLTKPYLLDSYFGSSSNSVLKYVRHERRGGSPYSVGPTWDFTSQQWAILGALGISRVPS